MDNMEDYYRGLHKAESQHRAAAETANCRNSESGTDNSASDGGVFQDEDPCDFTEYQSSDEHEHYTCMWDEAGDDDIVLESTSLDPAACPTSVAPGGEVAGIIKNFEKHRILQGISESLGGSARPLWRTEDFPPVELMKKWVRDGKTDKSVISQVSSTVNMRDTQVIELLDDPLLGCNMEWKRVMSLIRSPLLTKQFACVRDVYQAFSLNERQYYAVKAIAKALISRWRQAEDSILQDSSFETALRDGQLLLFLGGEGGTGKSRVIDAVQALCESWGRSHCIVKTAMTGKAATIISGRTLASFLLQIRKRRASDTLVNLELLIVDEVSMMMKYQLAQLDIRLRAVKRGPGVVFGGVHIILVGDFLQLPPVGGTPLYLDPAQRRKQASANEIAGYQLWRLFKDVIILKESVRFHKDPEWGRGCQQARRGVWTSEFVSIINCRVMTYGDAMNNSIASRNVETVVTPDNMTRVAINNLFIRTTAQYLPEGEYPVRVVANFKGKLRKLSCSEVTMIMGLPDTEFGRMAPYLDLIVGMPIQVFQNVRAEKMVANGTIGHLEAIRYHPDTDFRLVHDSVADITVKVPSMPPPVLVRIDRGSSAIAMHGCPHANLFPLFFESQAYGACDIALPGSVRGVPRSLSLRIQQFPFVCAVSSTPYKVQGETLDSMVVTEWRSKKAAANKREQLYLLVSRVTTREAFVTLQPLTNDIMSWAHPSQAALDEEDRLELLSCETIQRLQQPSNR